MAERPAPERGPRRGRLLTYPNAVTVLRFPLAVAFPLVDGALPRAAIILAGGLSDWLDGWLSRRLEQASGFGELVDPIADKTFVLAVLGTLRMEGHLANLELALLLIRDLYNVLAFFVVRLLGITVRFRSRPTGKLATAFQVATALALVLAPTIGHALVWATGAIGALAIIDYTAAGVRGLRPRSGGA